MPGRSSPRAATSVATRTRARPSRSAFSARVRSACVSSPEIATTSKPRSPRLAAVCCTASRVARNTSALARLERRAARSRRACSRSRGATRCARYAMSACASLGRRRRDARGSRV